MLNPASGNQSDTSRFLNEIESKRMLKQAGLTVTEPFLAQSCSDAISIAQRLGFPVVLKVVSGEIIHKSDAGGVLVNLTDSKSVGLAYTRMMDSIRKKFPEAAIDGISVQKQAAPGTEVIIGMTRDPQFGPAIMFGLGGVWVEIFNDVSLRIAPLSREDISEMLRELKSYKLFQGYRGQPKIDTLTLEDWLLRVSALVMNNPRIKELDINPIFAYADGALVVDARILLEDEGNVKAN
jgi:acetate---CoA ligase (ADP-forming) subunit beta